MSPAIISSFEKLVEQFPSLEKARESNARLAAVKRYFAKGGVVSCRQGSGAWPELTYPTPFSLRAKLEDLQKRRDGFAEKKREWEKRMSAEKSRQTKSQFKKFIDPYYWKHFHKSLVDADYRADAEKVNLPVHLVSEKRWKPMIKMFVDDLDYRKQLTETVETSIVYKGDKRLAKYAGQLQDFRKEVSQKKRNHFHGKVTEIDADIQMLQHVLAWAQE